MVGAVPPLRLALELFRLGAGTLLGDAWLGKIITALLAQGKPFMSCAALTFSVISLVSKIRAGAYFPQQLSN